MSSSRGNDEMGYRNHQESSLPFDSTADGNTLANDGTQLSQSGNFWGGPAAPPLTSNFLGNSSANPGQQGYPSNIGRFPPAAGVGGDGSGNGNSNANLMSSIPSYLFVDPLTGDQRPLRGPNNPPNMSNMNQQSLFDPRMSGGMPSGANNDFRGRGNDPLMDEYFALQAQLNFNANFNAQASALGLSQNQSSLNSNAFSNNNMSMINPQAILLQQMMQQESGLNFGAQQNNPSQNLDNSAHDELGFAAGQKHGLDDVEDDFKQGKRKKASSPETDFDNTDSAQGASDENIQSEDLFEFIESSELISSKHQGLVPDSIFVAVGQMKPCGLAKEDRIGKYKSRQLGFVGMCCKHCKGQPGFGRYFPGSFNSFLSGKNCENMVDHLLKECRDCPERIRLMIMNLDQREKNSRTRPPHGSRKRFFFHIWTRLREIKLEDGNSKNLETMVAAKNITRPQLPQKKTEIAARGYKTLNASISAGAGAKVDDGTVPFIDWEPLLEGNELLSLDDKDMISAYEFVSMAQMKPCRLTASDKIGWYKSRVIGYPGLCCKHCGGRPSFGRYFPNSARSFSQATTIQTIACHVGLYCKEVPKDIRKLVTRLQQIDNSRQGEENESSKKAQSHGLRKVFYDRLWKKLHSLKIEEMPPDNMLERGGDNSR